MTTQQMRPMPATQAPTSAVVGFILAFLCWPAGLVVSRRALKTVRRRRSGGRGLATAGVAVSVVSGVAMVVLFAVATVGTVRAESFGTKGRSAACQLEVERVNSALAAHRSAGEPALTGTAAARLTALQDAGYLDKVPAVPGWALDADGRFAGRC